MVSAACCLIWTTAQPAVWAFVPLAVVGCGCFLVWGSRDGFKGALGALLANPVAVYLGRISYGIYLYQMVTPLLVDKARHAFFPVLWHLQSGVAGFFFNSICTVAIAALSYRYLEQPLIVWGAASCPLAITTTC